MEIEYPDGKFERSLFGVSGMIGDSIPESGMKLMQKFFGLKKVNDFNDKGIMHWVYPGEGQLFVGMEAETPPGEDSGFELLQLNMNKYAKYTHIGSYDKLHEVHENMRKEISNAGKEPDCPCLEIYSHWNEDENKLVTDVVYSINKDSNDD